MKIKITEASNAKLLENFPDDPYSDIVIRSGASVFRLVLAYLAIDSSFFGELEGGLPELDLSHLPE